jgi:signal transduction histidine kinase
LLGLASLRPTADERAIEVVVMPVPPTEVACSVGALTSVMSNLVGNALKYTTQGRVTVRSEAVDGVVRVEVEDTGPGLPQDVPPESLFDPYVRGNGVSQPGMGLGLATVKRLVEGHGGQVGVRPSARTKGCLFWFTLPTVKSDHPSA